MEYRQYKPDELVAGPWTLEEYGLDPGRRFTIPEISVDIRAIVGGSGPVGTDNPNNYLITPEGAQAIAHLIQMAPEMLKLLQRTSDLLPRDSPLAEKIDDVLARATRKYVPPPQDPEEVL